MKAARMHEYGKPPVLEDVPVPDIQPDDILVNVHGSLANRPFTGRTGATTPT